MQLSHIKQLVLWNALERYVLLLGRYCLYTFLLEVPHGGFTPPDAGFELQPGSTGKAKAAAPSVAVVQAEEICIRMLLAVIASNSGK
jgi:hypothetical protein